MNPLLPLAASFAAGGLLGLLFFWGLWLTVNSIVRAPHPALRVLGSLLLRFGLLLGGFYLLARYGGWQHLLAGAAGFTAARLLLLRRLPPSSGRGASEA
jgi:F1F0 ATPase subunit 2